MVFTTALFISALTLLSGIAQAVPTGKGGCDKPVRMISVRGSDEVLGNSVIKTVFSSLLQSGTNAYLQGTPYPAVQYAAYEASESAGVGSLKSLLQEATEMCPQQKLVLVGYSQGAAVVMDSLCGWESNGQDGVNHPNIAAVVVFGDPEHASSQSFVSGGGYGNGSVGRTGNVQCAPYTSRILSICHAGDPVCNQGGDMSQHLNYMPGQNSEAVQFINSKL